MKKIIRRKSKSKAIPSIFKNLPGKLKNFFSSIPLVRSSDSTLREEAKFKPAITFKKIGKITGILVLILLIGFFSLFLAVLLGLFGEIPSTRQLSMLQTSAPSELYTADGLLIGRFYKQDRTNISYKQISDNVIGALIATEDSRFYQHHGIDSRSIFRVIFKTLLLQQESSGGGSTITQQLAKNLYPRKRYSFLSTPINKFKEMIIANRFEEVFTKEQILELYLNTVPMGGNIFGIERAAQRFFDTSAKKIKIEQAAVLVGMLKATTTYNPKLHPERAKERRNVVLSQMVKANILEPGKADSLRALPLELNYNSRHEEVELAPYFKEYLRPQLEEFCQTQTKENGEPYDLYSDGLKIYTTIDSRIQKAAERAVIQRLRVLQEEFDKHWSGRNPWGKNTGLITKAVQSSARYKHLQEEGYNEDEINEEFRKKVNTELYTGWGYRKVKISPIDSVRYYQKMLNTGLLSMDPRTGFIKAWVGGINYKTFKYDHILSRRQVGSTFKPFVYAAALEGGIEPCEYFQNSRLTYPAYENWSPQNSDGQYGGEYNMRGALAHSINTISAQILMRIGIQPTIQFAHQLGIKSSIPAVPSIALGTANLSLLEMVPAYSTFINNGKYLAPVYLLRITDRIGKPLKSFVPVQPKYAFSAYNARTMLELLKGVVEEGTASRLRTEYGLSMDIAGKTGTTQNHADGWFIGVTPNLVTGVWVGGESPLIRFRTLDLGQGAHTALPVWGEFMRKVSALPAFQIYNYAGFEPLSLELQERLSCPSSRYEEPEEPVVEEKKESFFDKLFKNKNKNKKGKKKGWKLFNW
ncbi:penicillin-binding protein 1A [Desertivirga arenae]|uniref:penicillin-binding protein 1A n=1 Tax=Desertivirga arenae TaxID=2810309 RepID=UPI001A965D8E|nr:transglycosylase domain-containing protein [Pedobacter sp. SYSU D00823]